MSDNTETAVAPAATAKPKAKVKPKAKAKAKRKTASKPAVKVINDGFIQRNAKPAIMGKALKSRMVRVDAELAEYMRAEAMKAGTSITEVSRSIFQAITD